MNRKQWRKLSLERARALETLARNRTPVELSTGEVLTTAALGGTAITRYFDAIGSISGQVAYFINGAAACRKRGDKGGFGVRDCLKRAKHLRTTGRVLIMPARRK